MLSSPGTRSSLPGTALSSAGRRSPVPGPARGARWLASRSGARTHYEVLGLKRDCTLDEVKAAYRAMAKQTHPDVSAAGQHGGHQEFLQVSEAVKVLSSPMLRAAYDLDLARRAHQPTGTRHAAPASTSTTSDTTASETPHTSSDYVPPTYSSSRATEADTVHFRNIINLRGPRSQQERELFRNARAAPLHAFSGTLAKLLGVPVAFAAAISISWAVLGN
jgi:curved DNA-binding protein CbpA